MLGLPRTLQVLLAGALLLLGAAGCGRREGPAGETEPAVRVLGVADVESRDGRLWVKGTPEGTSTNGWFTGQLRESYADGALKAEAMVRDGRMHGLTRGFYPSGTVQAEESFVEGVSDGVRRRFYEDGTLKSLEEIQRGRLHGRHERYHPNGMLAEKATYRDGQPDGLGESWDATGQLLGRVQFEAGRVVEQTFKSDPEARLAQEIPRQ